MRIRPIAALSVAAFSAVLLAGCASGANPNATPAPSTSGAAADLCAAAAPSGAASDSITVEGEVGEKSTATFSAPLEVEELQSTVVSEGEGDPVAAGDLVTYALTAFSAETGEELGSFGYDDAPVLPQQISGDNPLGQLLGCATPGTRVVAAFPATEQGAAEVYVVDLLEVVPNAAWGDPVDPAEGLPTVELADDGAPTVTLPEGDAPTEFEKATLKEGDGPVVAAGDGVLVQYHGVSWDTGEVFDESWGGAPFSFTAGSGVVQGFTDAVVGETVGSQVIAVLPPAVAYGEGEINDADLKGQTLVFVVDILGVQPAETPAQ
ncbi:FKBP-type peptidyl-prolyl cis-trans isomerase [Microbacterium sp. NPDC056003]|uniref:FKBP-type peptidyl-prolyl cis-trans isomerase n=1 Tax=Microbacterium sp. NPDC056003 TaxID=3345676 RepID=UPI0035E1981B